MVRGFNVAGPCFPDEHYMIPAERRAAEAAALIESGRWFSLVSGRQTGKTTVVKHLARSLTARGDLLVLFVDLQTARGVDDPAVAFRRILGALDEALLLQSPELPRLTTARLGELLQDPLGAVSARLREICAAAARPLVLLFDEADVLTGPAMVSFLTQLRSVYLSRDNAPAPRSVVLIGIRTVRDYLTASDGTSEAQWLGSSSPFNITVEDVTLPAFSRGEVEELVGLHTAETGQRFEPTAIHQLYELTAGHPWLVNALADQVTRRDLPDRSVTVTAMHIEAAKDTLILERRTHLDSLLARLREPRVQRVLDPMLAGSTTSGDVLDDDFAYVAGLGLIALVGGSWQIANPIYREVVPRALNIVRQTQIPHQTAAFVTTEGLLDVPLLMAAWQSFWREDGHLAADGFTYEESGPHLMLMAFLQRIVNGGGRIDREYALGRGALDLLITWRSQRIAIEVKVRRDASTEARSLTQAARYLEHLGLEEGWLVLFDLRSARTWEERLFTRTERVGHRSVHLVGS